MYRVMKKKQNRQFIYVSYDKKWVESSLDFNKIVAYICLALVTWAAAAPR